MESESQVTECMYSEYHMLYIPWDFLPFMDGRLKSCKTQTLETLYHRSDTITPSGATIHTQLKTLVLVELARICHQTCLRLLNCVVLQTMNCSSV